MLAEDFFKPLVKEAYHGPLMARHLDLFLKARLVNVNTFQKVEGCQDFTKVSTWQKSTELKGGGMMTVLRGSVLEKAAVNMSLVWGDQYPALEQDYAGQPFTALGVSLICHPRNPFAPIAHMNVRIFAVGDKVWLGGGADLTPMVRYEDDVHVFFKALETACANKRLGDFERYKKWCDEYFFITHRKETRGVGGIFFDHLALKEDSDIDLLTDVAQNFAEAYGSILVKRVSMPFEDKDRDQHLYWRARYAEFNLLYDRGTRFGLMSGGNFEAIFASMPPVVKW